MLFTILLSTLFSAHSFASIPEQTCVQLEYQWGPHIYGKSIEERLEFDKSRAKFWSDQAKQIHEKQKTCFDLDTVNGGLSSANSDQSWDKHLLKLEHEQQKNGQLRNAEAADDLRRAIEIQNSPKEISPNWGSGDPLQ